MTTSVIVESGGIEVWCDYCGSVAWFAAEIFVSLPADLDVRSQPAVAARLHEGNDCAPIFLDAQGEPTTVTTSTYAGGCSMLLEYAQEQDRLAAAVSS